MAMRSRRAAWPALAAIGAAAVLAGGCYTAPGPYAYPPPPAAAGYYAPPPEAPYPVDPYYAVDPYYEPASPVVVVNNTPPPVYGANIFYHGPHPHPVGYALGSFCQRSGPHHHAYAPYRNHRYEFFGGYYYWVGDPLLFGLRGPAYAYYGNHPHYFGGYCYVSGRHHHRYPPLHRNRYALRNDVLFYRGSFGGDYYQNRYRYDERGWRRDRGEEGYHDHERDHREARDRTSRPSRRESTRVVSPRDGGGRPAATDRAIPQRRRSAPAAARPNPRQVRNARDEGRRSPEDDRRDVRVARSDSSPPPRQRVHTPAPAPRDRRAAAPNRPRTAASPVRKEARERSANRRVDPPTAVTRRPAPVRSSNSVSRRTPQAQRGQVPARREARQVVARPTDQATSKQSARKRREPRRGRESAEADGADARAEPTRRRSRAGGR